MGFGMVVYSFFSWEKMVIVSFYFIVLILFFSFSSFLLFWFLMEINLISYLIMLSSFYNKGNNRYQILFYFLIQTAGSIVMLMWSFNYFHSSEILFNSFMTFTVFFKVGIFPFHSWILSLGKFLSEFTLGVLLSLQKLPMFILMFFSDQDMVLMFLMMNLIFGSAMLLNSYSKLDLVIFSSMYSTFWFFLLLVGYYKVFTLFLMQYCFMVCWLLFLHHLSYKENNVFLILISMFLMGIPPLSFFFFKYYFVSILYNEMSNLLFIFIWISIYLSFLGYLKFFLKFFMMSEELYMNFLKSHVWFYLTSSFLGFFLFF